MLQCNAKRQIRNWISWSFYFLKLFVSMKKNGSPNILYLLYSQCVILELWCWTMWDFVTESACPNLRGGDSAEIYCILRLCIIRTHPELNLMIITEPCSHHQTLQRLEPFSTKCRHVCRCVNAPCDHCDKDSTIGSFLERWHFHHPAAWNDIRLL